MREEYFLAKFKGETFKALKTGTTHNVVVRRKFRGGYTVGLCRGYETAELPEYRKNYDSLAAFLDEWKLQEAIEPTELTN